MKFNLPQSKRTFEIPDEWWKDAGIEGYIPRSLHYHSDPTCSMFVPFNEIAPPLRDGDTIWFRDRQTVIQLLSMMRDGVELPPIEVWGKEKKCSDRFVVRDGFHRFYLSIAIAYIEIPVRINNFDAEEFFANEAKGLPCVT
jgi:hypothetical protein